MSAYFLLFAALSILGSLTYNVCMKLNVAGGNPFGFLLSLSLFTLLSQAVCCLVARYAFKTDVLGGLNMQAMLLGLVAGCAVTLTNIAYFYALRNGTLVQAQTFWTVGGTVALAVVAVLFFKETITPTKAAGIALGIVSLFLLAREQG